MTELILTTFIFVWPSQHITAKVQAHNWNEAYSEAVERCVDQVRRKHAMTGYETVIDICANPKELFEKR